MELAAPVTRSVDLPASLDAAWASIRDADGLAGWLGDSVELDDVAPGVAGIVRDGDAVRRIVVTEVDAGRSIGFVWWDEASPEQASVVTIAVAPSEGEGEGEGEGDTARVTVTERLAGSAHASIGGASIGDLVAAAGAPWDRRLQALVGACAPSDALV